jgi:F0F1-type ATP synthase membrane subunit c/vacuolar-type H+-ATPase subunit K
LTLIRESGRCNSEAKTRRISSLYGEILGVWANGIAAIGSGHNVFGATMVMAVFPELYAILGLLVLILISGTIPA